MITAATGYVFTAPEGTAPPTPAAISSFDPASFGSEVQTVAVTGGPTGGTFTLSLGAQTTSAIPYNATPAQVQDALEALSNIGEGNVAVAGGPLPGTAVTVTFVGALAGASQTLMTGSATGLTGGTSPAINVTRTTTATGWKNIGHTSAEDLPEFGFEGGDTETKGTWQSRVLKTVTTEAASDYVTFKVHQFDEENLGLYYGTANGSSTVGVFRVKKPSTSAVRRALLIVIVDGDVTLGFYAPKTDIKRDDAIELATDDFGAMPLRSTFLQYIHPSEGEIYFDWISEDTGVNPT
ncbi:phage tail protein [Amycolatopsis anabasis]|uniref:phage tail tube protein n=1 Tax=Amycolatopsis anabasis TaxID=1840409 RepID=UPI0015D45C6C|nr:phage tail protein [Amycolatopsis anabasis]